MSVIGKLNRTRTDKGEILTGNIATIEVQLSLRLYPTGEDAGSQYPSHRVRAVVGDGGEVEVGAAWTKKMIRAGKAGEEFLSISIDDPSLTQPLNVAAFQEPGEDFYSVTFRRRKAKA